jgi:hypothetical protein
MYAEKSGRYGVQSMFPFAMLLGQTNTMYPIYSLQTGTAKYLDAVDGIWWILPILLCKLAHRAFIQIPTRTSHLLDSSSSRFSNYPYIVQGWDKQIGCLMLMLICVQDQHPLLPLKCFPKVRKQSLLWQYC